MNRPRFNPPLPLIRQKVSVLNFNQLIVVAEAVVAGLTANALTYVTPVPLPATITTAITALKVAKAALGPKSNKGSMADLLTTKNKATVLKGLLSQIYAYIYNTASIVAEQPVATADILALSGAALKNKRSIITNLQAPQRLHQVNSKKYPWTTFTLRWKPPTGLFKGARPKGYNIYVGNPASPLTETLLATTTKCLYVVPSGLGENIFVRAVWPQGLSASATIAVPLH